ncbi:MAG: hypothetical protein OMM_07434 [Candidatus Magnetoglobus multicellularis str. Araruama]|uniref:Uncharacterized protein n=1 Tax=Candidatus Magnetoglobus multicellularis str. Araruama TaxID=890399 RepID=A0A1V1PCJ7_9BACT|nr:MAG: hypothetical protein OMM_07434 [Candidatus Magnetoglobus multicellularis str. Araruama]
MAIIIITEEPRWLLNAIYEELDDDNIRTWIYDKERDLTHSPKQWKNLAWMRPKIRKGRLIFNIIAGEEILSKRVYGVYHGRLIEMLLTHFDMDIDKIYATPQPTLGDVVE